MNEKVLKHKETAAMHVVPGDIITHPKSGQLCEVISVIDGNYVVWRRKKWKKRPRRGQNLYHFVVKPLTGGYMDFTVFDLHYAKRVVVVTVESTTEAEPL
jgi:hypothetical protein